MKPWIILVISICLFCTGCNRREGQLSGQPKSVDSKEIFTERMSRAMVTGQKNIRIIHEKQETPVFRYAKFELSKIRYREQTKNIFDQHSPFEIISSSRGITKQSSATDTNMCTGWTIPKRKIYTVIKDSKIVSGTEWDLYFDVLPCIIQGKLKQKGVIFNYEVNGGSWIYIQSIDTTVILGNYNKDDRKYFISGAMPD